MFTIHSIGDAGFLEQILIAVAMVTGSGDFEKMVCVGLLLGAILVGFQSLFQGAKTWDWHQVFVCWLIYSLAFGATTTVTIEDAYDGDVRVVANVPIGPAAVGSMISEVGYGLTKLFEVAYSPIAPGITEHKFLDSLELLVKLRNTQMQSAMWDAWNNALGGGDVDVNKSLINYVAECTAVKFVRGEVTEAQLNTQNWQQALQFQSQLFGTQLFLSPSGPTDETCTSGWVKLSQAIDTAFAAGLSQQTLGYLVGKTDAVNATTDALDALHAQNVATGDYIKAHILKPIMQRGFAQFYSDMRDPYAEIMLKQAEMQRNTQWTAEQNLWMKSIRPLMTLIEGLVYAITPLAAFIMVIGSKGIMLVGKYFQMLIWIQLWMPVMSIINLYIYTQGQEVLSNYLSMGSLTSFEGIAYAGTELERWIAIGGMMAAATPGITLLLVTGSGVAFNALAQRVSGSDTIDEKMMSPDLLQRSAVVSQQPMFQQSQAGGSLISGADSLLDKVNVGQTLSSAVSSSKTASAQATQGFAQQLSNSVFSGDSADQSYSRLQGLGQTLRSSHSSQAKSLYGEAQDYARQYGLSESHTDAIAGALAMQATGAVDATKLAGALSQKLPMKLQGSLSTSAESRSSDQKQQLTTDLDKLSQNLGFSKEDSAALTQDLARQTNTEAGQRLNHSLGEEQRQQLSRSASQAMSTQETYQRLSNAQSSIGTTSQMDIRALAGQVNDNPEAFGHIHSGMKMASGETRQLAAEKARFYQAMGMDAKRAVTGGQIYALLNSHQGTEQALAAETIATATGGKVTQGLGNFGENQLLMQQAPVIHASEHQPALSQPKQMTNTQRLSSQPVVPDSSGVLQRHDQNVDDVKGAYANQGTAFKQERLDALKAQIMSTPVKPSTAANVFATADGAGRFFDRVVGGSGAVMDGFSSNFAGSMHQLAQMTPVQREQFITDANQGDQYIKDKYGVAGQMAVAAADLGRNVIGAGVSGYYAAKEWLTGKSDLSEAAKGLSTKERGMFFASALASASEAGAEKAQAFVQQYGDEFRQLAVQTAMHDHGLQSQAGAQLFAASLLGASDGQEQTYRQQLQQEMGDPALGNRAADIIESAAQAGKDQAGGYLAPVSRYFAVQQGGGKHE
ncbi:conjugal transfer protein TraG [Vibrio cholerae]|nr:conjugal transfer protein TraG [Vibrio cholerae]EIN5961520.1 conjugal transfer protein TraG N-terminal domain-containing protein [Vibrio cholerae]EJU9689490.1 conjugal transfer protein TraG N-terminal domain-containing protein [Vibrio cholerae]